MNEMEVKGALLRFLKDAEVKQQVFYGKKRKSKTFIVYGIVKELIIIEYDSYPSHYVLDTAVLVRGLLGSINKMIDLRLTSDYAQLVEHAKINRNDTDNKTSVLTKFYYSIHKAFLNSTYYRE